MTHSRSSGIWYIRLTFSCVYQVKRLNLTSVVARGGGALNVFSGRGVRPGFPKCGACELTFASEKGGLWAENFQIWGLVSWKFPNLGASELKFGWKLRLLRQKFPNFLKRGSCELTLYLEMGSLRAAGEAWKWGLQGRTSPYPLSRSVPPPPRGCGWLWS